MTKRIENACLLFGLIATLSLKGKERGHGFMSVPLEVAAGDFCRRKSQVTLQYLLSFLLEPRDVKYYSKKED